MKQIITLFLIFLISGNSFGLTFEKGQLVFSTTSNLNVQVIARATNNTDTEIIIPTTVENLGITYTVNTILDSAFKNNQLTTVIIPNSITSIGYEAFQNNQLKKIIIPNSVTFIGPQAFKNNQLTTVTISNRISGIDDETFKNNQLKTVVIPKNITFIGHSAFKKNQLTSITIPNNVTTILHFAFDENPLTTVNILAEILIDINNIDNPFGNNILKIDLYLVSTAAKLIYETAEKWIDFKKKSILSKTEIPLI